MKAMIVAAVMVFGATTQCELRQGHRELHVRLGSLADMFAALRVPHAGMA